MGQAVVVTGAGGGLGAFVTRAFLAAGAAVAGVSRSISPSAFNHPNFHAVPCDLITAEGARAAVEAAITRLGRIDVLAHVAGGFSGGDSVWETADAVWDHMMDLNLRAAFNTFRAALPFMREAGRGRIVAVAAKAAAEPAPGIAAYAASKAGLVSLVRTVALENRDRHITANVILPGAMDTPANRAADPTADTSLWIDPAHVAALIVFLASDDAAEITGAAIPIG